jgi:predicted small lipoprotein YifL
MLFFIKILSINYNADKCKNILRNVQNKRAFLYFHNLKFHKENVMKKILAIFFALALVFALCACGRDKNKGTTAPITTPTTASQVTTTRRSEITTPSTASATNRTDRHPTEGGGTTASQSIDNGIMPGFSSTAPVGTAPGGSTSVR